jgi:dTDP-glucose pyrophosphorylase
METFTYDDRLDNGDPENPITHLEDWGLSRPSKASAFDLVVGRDATILDCMKVIDFTGFATALICDENRKVLATITDGDIRRFLIEGGRLADLAWKAAAKNFASVEPGVDRTEAIQTLLRKRIRCLPVVGPGGELLDIITLRHALMGKISNSWAVIMAGGKGSRLGELTQGLPKPMLPVGGAPILEHIVEHLVSHGIRRIFIAVNYLANMIEDHFGDGSQFFCQIEYLREKESLGTGGALSLLPETPTHPVVVMNGDLMTRINITRLLEFHEHGGYTGSIALREHEVVVPFGVAELDGSQISQLVEKPSLNYQINAGIYILNPELVARIPENTFYPITHLWQDCLSSGEALGAYAMHESWNDIGLPEQYQAAEIDPVD